VKLIDATLNDAILKAKQQYAKLMNNFLTEATTKAKVQQAHVLSEQSAWEAFDNVAKIAKAESSFSVYKNQAKDELKQLYKIFLRFK